MRNWIHELAEVAIVTGSDPEASKKINLDWKQKLPGIRVLTIPQSESDVVGSGCSSLSRKKLGAGVIRWTVTQGTLKNRSRRKSICNWPEVSWYISQV